MMVQASEELIKIAEDYTREINETENELARLRGERQERFNAEAQQRAEFKVGQRVRNNKHRYEITKITGWLARYDSMGLPPQLTIEYHGRLVKVDGSLGEREKQIFNLRVDNEQAAT